MLVYNNIKYTTSERKSFKSWNITKIAQNLQNIKNKFESGEKSVVFCNIYIYCVDELEN